MQRTKRFTGFVATVAATVGLIGSGLAGADDVIVDGDGLVPVSTNALAFGDVCANTTVERTVLIAVTRSGGGGNTFANNANVTVSLPSNAINDARLSAVMLTNAITLPGNWSSLGAGTTSAAVSSRVRFTAGAAGTSLGSAVRIKYQATAGTVSRQTDLRVTANVVACDTTPPTVNVPATITAEATGPAGSVVSYTATATDTAPASPAVTCAPPSGSTFPIGTTTVTCQATDAAGNTGTGSFAVVVRDTTPPVITDVPNAFDVEATSTSGAVVTYDSPTASDVVDGPRPVSCTPASGAVLPFGTSTVSCTASDSRGNGASSTFAVTVADTTAPSLVVPGTVTAEATSAAGAHVTFTTSATDAVDGDVPTDCAPASGTTFPLGTTTVSCTANDHRGNATSGDFAVVVRDTTAPAVHGPGSFSVEATGPAGAVATFAVSASDLVDGERPVTCTTPAGSTFRVGSTDVVCEAVDVAGNRGRTGFTVTVTDRTAPVLTLPEDFTEEATGPTGATRTWTASASDLVDGNVQVVCVPTSGAMFPLETTTVDCSAVDSHANEATGSFTVTVEDTTSPSLTVDVEDHYEATGPGGAVVDFAPTAGDAVDEDVEIECSSASGSTFPLGDTEVTCTATDDYDNTADVLFTVVVVDTTAPTIGTPRDVDAEAQGADGAVVHFDEPADEDADDTAVDVDCVPPSGSRIALDTPTVVTCTATDDSGNEARSSFTILVSDTTAPALTLPKDVTAEATGPDGADVDFTATANDVVDGDVPVDCTPPSGSTFELGPTSVSCAATDAHGNTAGGGFVVTVVDTTPPAVTVPALRPAEATGPTGATVLFDVSADDLVDGAVVPSCDAESGDAFPLGTTTVTCTATDAAGNTDSESFDVTVVDTTAPALSLPGDATLEATGPSGAPQAFSATATDAVTTTVQAVCTHTSGATFPLGSTVVECSATDAAGNVETGSFTVTVVDTTAPLVTVPAAPVEAEATGPDGAVVDFASSAVDVVSGPLTATCSPASGTTFALGTTPVTCSATDAAGNTGAETFTVSVVDTTAPSIGDPTDVIAEATDSAGAVITYAAPAATDVVDGVVAVTCEPPSGATFALGATTVTCAANDAAGNDATRSFVVTVRDTTAPTLLVPAPFTVEATGPAGATVPFAASASDRVDGTVAPVCVPPSGSTFPLGETQVDCTATDAAGNRAERGFSVTVVDTTAPVVDVPDDVRLEATGPAGAAHSFLVSASDAVDGISTPGCSHESGATFPLGTTVVSCSATDAAGNTGTASFAVTVVDTTKPTLTLPDPITTTATGASGAAVTYSVSATDVVDGDVTVVCTPPSGSTFAPGTTTVACSATDAAGNTAAGSVLVSVVFDAGELRPPVNPGVLNTVRGGSTVPLKWQVRAAGGELITSTAIVQRFVVVQVACTTLTAVVDPVELTTTGGTTLRYDAGSSQFVQNWQTPRSPGRCYHVDVVLTSGQRIGADFQLK